MPGWSRRKMQHGNAAAQHIPENITEPQQSALPVFNREQPQPAPEEKKHEACEDCPTALPPPRPLPASTAAEPGQASTASLSDQHASAASGQPASAADASHSRVVEPMPASDECQPLRPHEQKVAAALLVVLKKALNDDPAAMTTTKEVLVSNNPQLEHFLRLVPDEGELPSLKQLEKSASSALRDCLDHVSEVCAAAECQPLEMLIRSIQCRTHLTALQSAACGSMAARRQRLQALAASLAISSTAKSRDDEIFKRLHTRVGLLAKYGIPPKSRAFVTAILHEAITLLDLDKEPKEGASAPAAAGSASSFTACLDHMLPGEETGLCDSPWWHFRLPGAEASLQLASMWLPACPV